MLTCAGRRVALIDAFRNALEELGVAGKIIAADASITSPAYHKADIGVLMPPVRQIEYMPALLKAVKKHEVGLLVPMTDLDLRAMARRRQEFVDAGCVVPVGSEEAVMQCRDKRLTQQLIERASLESIRTLSLKEYMAAPFFPAFLKPVSGSAGVGAAVVRNQRELNAHVAVFGDALVAQDHVAGKEYTIDVYRSRDGKVRAVVPRQRLAVRSGEVEKGITVKDAELIESATKLAAVLGDIWGVFCCQCRRESKTGARARFFEINPRFGGGVPLSIAAGANLPLYLVQEVLGLTITAKRTFTPNLLMMRYDEAMYVKIKNPAELPGFDTPSFR